MPSIPRFIAYEGYEVLDFKEFLSQERIEIHLERKKDKPFDCYRCGTPMGAIRGRYRLRIKEMPIFNYECRVWLWRYQGYCFKCKKSRSEAVSFISSDTPHLTARYAWFLGNLFEIAAVSRVAEMFQMKESTALDLDFNRLKRLLTQYKIPEVTEISVDEVYARKHDKFEGESRSRRFFTIVSDLKTHRVIWASESRDTEALDQFFILLGEEACSKIKVVAADQHEDYAKSVKSYCPNATLVWDRFHIMKNFEEAVNEQRKELHEEQARGSELQRLTRGKFRFLFLKKEKERTQEEKNHINDVIRLNDRFLKLELIKERMITFFNEKDSVSAKKIFEEIGDWIWQAGFTHLMKWYKNLETGWDTLKNYFIYRVTSSLSEGINNVIKALKRRAFGYKNMFYFRLKIMQVCGYLNSRYLTMHNQPLT
jgi:transposase